MPTTTGIVRAQDQQERPRQPGQRQLPLGDVEPRAQTQPGNGASA
ncbi:MAG: hypothetical protein WBL53_12320 [Pseudonocardiaceae bacterium]